LISAKEYNDNTEIQETDEMAAKPKIGIIYSIYSNLSIPLEENQ